MKRRSPLLDDEMLKQLLEDPDDTDSDPDYVVPPAKRAFGTLFKNKDVTTGTKAKTPSSEVLKCLESRLKEYRRQWNGARVNGMKQTMRRKMKRIKQIEELIKEVKRGKEIMISNIPDPFSSPHKKKVNGYPNTGNFQQSMNYSSDSQLIDSPPSIINEDNSNSNNTSGSLVPVVNSSSIIDEQNFNSSNCSGSLVPMVDSNNRKSVTLPRKQNYCIVCKKLIKEFCKHYEAVHRNTEEGLKLQELNKIQDKTLRKKLKTEVTDILRKKGNSEYSKLTLNETFIKEGKATVIPVKRSEVSSDQNNTVQCAHCLGFYKRRKFSQHVRKCNSFLKGRNTLPSTNTNSNSNLEGNVIALKNHSLPLIDKVVGASNALFNEVLTHMTPRISKDVAMKDSLIMRYASEFHKTRRENFQKDYVCRVITDLAKVLMRMQDFDESIKCLEDVFNPAYFNPLVKCILEEAGYDEEKGSLQVCGLGNRLRSHIRGAAETALKDAAAEEYRASSIEAKSLRKRVKHFLKLLEDKWANEAGRIFDQAVKQSRTEKEPKLAAEEDIVKTCQFVTSKYRSTIQDLDKAASGSIEKQQSYNSLLDLIVTHIMCLIRRRPVDFKRAQDMHYQKLDSQEDLINEIKNSKHMNLSEKDLELCNKFQIFYVPGKGWKEMVPIALTNVMREAMDALQRNKKHVGITSKTLFVRAKEMPVNPRECLRKVTKQLSLKKPLDLSGNGLRHHAGTFSKLHSSHPNYQDYLASALGHTLHIHRLHYEMPTSIVQKLIVCPVLHSMTQPVNERQEEDSPQNRGGSEIRQNVEISLESENQYIVSCQNTFKELHTMQEITRISQPLQKTPEKKSLEVEENYFEKKDIFSQDEESYTVKIRQRNPWTTDEKMLMYAEFGKSILERRLPSRHAVCEFLKANEHKFISRSVASLMSFLQSKCLRKAKNVTPEVKKFLTGVTHRKITNVPL